MAKEHLLSGANFHPSKPIGAAEGLDRRVTLNASLESMYTYDHNIVHKPKYKELQGMRSSLYIQLCLLIKNHFLAQGRAIRQYDIMLALGHRCRVQEAFGVRPACHGRQ